MTQPRFRTAREPGTGLVLPTVDALLDALDGGEPALAAGAVPVGRLLGCELGGGLHALLPPCAITSSRGM